MSDERVTSVGSVVSDMEAAFARKDVEGLVALFAEDATLESYMVARVLGRDEGVCRGRAEIRTVVGALIAHGVPWGGHGTPMIAGNTVAVEYTAASAGGEKFSVDIIEIRDGRIQSLRAYAGWRAVLAATREG